MKKTLFILAALLFAVGLSACGDIKNGGIPTDTDNTTSYNTSRTFMNETEKVTETGIISADIGETTAPQAGGMGGGGYDPFSYRFMEEACDIYILSFVFSWDEIIEYLEERSQNHTSEEMTATPLLYQLIKGLGVSKEDFHKANEIAQTKYTDEIIELLYCGDVNKVLEGLKSPQAFYWEGKVYAFYELYELNKENLLEIASGSEKFEEYLGMMSKELSLGYPHIKEMALELKAGLYK